ncbi:MAG: DUF1573 domain-containing protein [Victivallaceae bacterium]
MMRRLWWIPLVLACAAAAAEPAAALKVDAATHDFGEFYANLEQEHTFTVTNGGDKTVTLGRVRAGCPCTRIELSAKELKPSESATVAIHLNANSQSGEFALTFYLETDVDGQRFVRLTLKGTATPLLKFANGMQLDAGTLKEGTAGTYEFAIMAAEPDVKLAAEVSETSPAKVNLSRKGDDWVLTVSYTAGKEDRFDIPIKINVLSPSGWPPYRVRVHGKVER